MIYFNYQLKIRILFQLIVLIAHNWNILLLQIIILLYSHTYICILFVRFVLLLLNLMLFLDMFLLFTFLLIKNMNHLLANYYQNKCMM